MEIKVFRRDWRDKIMKKDDNGVKKMEQAILLSIQPQHAVKILNGDKTIEIRKTMPKCELPIDVYLYCKKSTKDILYKYKDKYYTQHYLTFTDSVEVLNSKVVAKFTLNKTEEIMNFNWESQTATLSPFDLSLKSCISIKDLNNEFSNCKAFHIDDLVIFDKPMELREFSIFKRDCPPYTGWVEYRVRKAPQSWQYVYKEEQNGDKL